eukprot:534682-Amphidinium_carterae.2
MEPTLGLHERTTLQGIYNSRASLCTSRQPVTNEDPALRQPKTVAPSRGQGQLGLSLDLKSSTKR